MAGEDRRLPGKTAPMVVIPPHFVAREPQDTADAQRAPARRTGVRASGATGRKVLRERRFDDAAGSSRSTRRHRSSPDPAVVKEMPWRSFTPLLRSHLT